MMSVQSSLVIYPIPCLRLGRAAKEEGTHDVHALILGRAQTGISAF
jgi:hypothetical protein